MKPTSTNDVASLCGAHLREEERLLAAALPVAQGIQLRLTQRDPGQLTDLAERHQDLTKLIRDMHSRRETLRNTIADRLQIAAEDIRLSKLIDKMPPETREVVRTALARVRRLADELVATNHRLSLHLNIHLDAYQRLLRDLTGTDSGSGRYGPRGKAETPDYRPLIQLHG